MDKISLNYDSITVLSNQSLLIDALVTERTSRKLTEIDFILKRQFIYAGPHEENQCLLSAFKADRTQVHPCHPNIARKKTENTGNLSFTNVIMVCMCLHTAL